MTEMMRRTMSLSEDTDIGDQLKSAVLTYVNSQYNSLTPLNPGGGEESGLIAKTRSRRPCMQGLLVHTKIQRKWSVFDLRIIDF